MTFIDSASRISKLISLRRHPPATPHRSLHRPAPLRPIRQNKKRNEKGRSSQVNPHDFQVQATVWQSLRSRKHSGVARV
jgi:hypothetical protein